MRAKQQMRDCHYGRPGKWQIHKKGQRTERQKNNETDMSSEGGRHGDEAVRTYASQPESSGFKSQLRHFFACLSPLMPHSGSECLDTELISVSRHHLISLWTYGTVQKF